MTLSLNRSLDALASYAVVILGLALAGAFASVGA